MPELDWIGNKKAVYALIVTRLLCSVVHILIDADANVLARLEVVVVFNVCVLFEAPSLFTLISHKFGDADTFWNSEEECRNYEVVFVWNL